MHRAEMLVINTPDQVATVRVADDEVVALLSRGHPPETQEMPEPGLYEIDLLSSGNNLAFPILVTVIPRAHVTAMRNMTLAMVDDLFRQVSSAVKSGQH